MYARLASLHYRWCVIFRWYNLLLMGLLKSPNIPSWLTVFLAWLWTLVILRTFVITALVPMLSIVSIWTSPIETSAIVCSSSIVVTTAPPYCIGWYSDILLHVVLLHQNMGR